MEFNGLATVCRECAVACGTRLADAGDGPTFCQELLTLYNQLVAS